MLEQNYNQTILKLVITQKKIKKCKIIKKLNKKFTYLLNANKAEETVIQEIPIIRQGVLEPTVEEISDINNRLKRPRAKRYHG